MLGLFKKFQTLGVPEKKLGELEKSLSPYLHQHSEEDKTQIICLAGLMARISYADMKITAEEKITISSSLKKHTNLSDEMITEIVDIATHTIKELGSLENHLYVSPLLDFYDESKRYELVEALFEIAASDGKVDSSETEEIRLINKTFGLSHHHFVSARAKVIEHVGTLKK
jgi:uncharacterized tellurite resistance protein B-like protein